jgi:glycosyltransferase involved in cell wall biosynthesis
MNQLVKEPSLVSIVTPAYNAGKYLSATLDSVLAQTYTHWELILVNDGSTDNTEAIIEPFLSDSRIRHVYQVNAGVSSARNKGIRMAKGDVIAFLDADDAWLPDNLRKKTTLIQEENVDWVYSNMYLGNAEMNITGKAPVGTDEEILKHLLLWDRETVPGPCSNLLVKKRCFENGLQFDQSFSTSADQDFLFNLSSTYNGKMVADYLVIYRILPDSMSRNLKRLEKDHLGTYRKAAKNGLFRSYLFKQHCFSNLYLILAGNWWKNGKNKPRSLWFILLSLISYPPVIFKLFKKLAR